MEDDRGSVPPPASKLIERSVTQVKKEEAVEYTPETGIYRVSFDGDTTTVTEAVVSTVAVVSEAEPTELSPLYSAVDPDALEAVIGSANAQPGGSDIHVTFTYEGHSVTVHSYGIIAVRPSINDERYAEGHQ